MARKLIPWVSILGADVEFVGVVKFTGTRIVSMLVRAADPYGKARMSMPSTSC